jgi:hypothetical protein
VALVHGNRLVKATVNTADELKELWALPSTKDKLRQANIKELVPSYPANTEILDQYLQEDEDIPPPAPVTTDQAKVVDSLGDQVKAPTGKLQPESGLKIKLNLKRLRELQLAEDLGNKRTRTASPSPSASNSDNDVIAA